MLQRNRRPVLHPIKRQEHTNQTCSRRDVGQSVNVSDMMKKYEDRDTDAIRERRDQNQLHGRFYVIFTSQVAFGNTPEANDA